MIKHHVICAFLGALFLLGCNLDATLPHDKFGPSLDLRYYEDIKKHMGTVEDAQAYFSGKTIRTYDASHGTQIEYHAPDGYAYLWYPGNTRAVVSRWKAQPNESGRGRVDFCYKYPSRSFNPVTKQFGGRWECQYITFAVEGMRERVIGDPFNLARGRLPSVRLGKENRTFDWVNSKLARPVELTFLETPRYRATR